VIGNEEPERSVDVRSRLLIFRRNQIKNPTFTERRVGNLISHNGVWGLSVCSVREITLAVRRESLFGLPFFCFPRCMCIPSISWLSVVRPAPPSCSLFLSLRGFSDGYLTWIYPSPLVAMLTVARREQKRRWFNDFAWNRVPLLPGAGRCRASLNALSPPPRLCARN